MSTPYAWYAVSSYAQIQDPDHPYRQADIVVNMPNSAAGDLRQNMKPGSRLYVYVDAVCCAAKGNPSRYWQGLQSAMRFSDPYDWYWCDNFGLPVLFGTDAWPLARYLPKNRIADELVEFCSTSPDIRAHDGIYLDQGTKRIPKRAWEKMSTASYGSLECEKQQTAHADYMNRLISGLRTKMDPGFKIIANTGETGNPPSTWTHPALDAITVEVGGGTTREEAINACKNQILHGTGMEVNVLWGAPEAPGSAIEGRGA